MEMVELQSKQMMVKFEHVPGRAGLLTEFTATPSIVQRPYSRALFIIFAARYSTTYCTLCFIIGVPLARKSITFTWNINGELLRWQNHHLTYS